MVVNDQAGDETRIAVLADGHLEELYSERRATATNVGNIYKGRVINVEPAIQAAFIDYGEGQNGFLHISDLHPRYFPKGKERTERVGKRIPRRDRPPMQAALRRGQEVLVQVLKEGIGTKGPTLTSYLSIPGRLMVAMPEMDRVGVSRKVESDDDRRAMRKVLDELDLPEGFGFILRTAGLGRTKTELKRDVAYLMRLWKVMDKRMKTMKAPCELYTESDLLIRTIRDVLRPTIEAVIVDTQSAYDRVTGFLKVVAPRSGPKVILYRDRVPIFHAFDVERQIDLIHSREVPLPSGGALVIDQTEALVAIDVNSGKSRSARDSETNAYHTNCEAVDEIARQLRLRDLGGLVIHDLIDMRSHKNRRAIEERFRQNLRRDRAKSTILRISEFGVIEMTRQRMRPSMRKSHFVPCTHCNGRGEVRSPEQVAADAMRTVALLLHYDRVHRVELVCSPRVASVLLSHKRRELVRLEEENTKSVDVRVSDAIASDRVDYYAYDDRNADIDITRLPAPKVPSLKELESAARKAQQAAEKAAATGGKTGADGKAPDFDAGEVPASEEAERLQPPTDEQLEERAAEDEAPRRRRRRSRRGGRRHRRAAEQAQQPQDQGHDQAQDQAAATEDGSRDTSKGKRKGKPAEVALAAKGHGTPAKSSGRTRAGSIRVHVLAKELGVPSKEILKRSTGDPSIVLKNHMASVTPEQADTIRGWFGADSKSDASSSTAKEKSPEPGAGGGDTARTDGSAGDDDARRRGRRRRRRGGRSRDRRTEPQNADRPQNGQASGGHGQRKSSAEPASTTATDQPSKADAKSDAKPDAKPDSKPEERSAGRKKRRRSGRDRDRDRNTDQQPKADRDGSRTSRPSAEASPSAAPEPNPSDSTDPKESQPPKKKRKRSRSSSAKAEHAGAAAADAGSSNGTSDSHEQSDALAAGPKSSDDGPDAAGASDGAAGPAKPATSAKSAPRQRGRSRRGKADTDTKVSAPEQVNTE